LLFLSFVLLAFLVGVCCAIVAARWADQEDQSPRDDHQYAFSYSYHFILCFASPLSMPLTSIS
jgi:hypothetical protein